LTPAEWARVAMENAVTVGGMERSIAKAVERAVREAVGAERQRYVERAIGSR
jgi:hypothetical protein